MFESLPTNNLAGEIVKAIISAVIVKIISPKLGTNSKIPAKTTNTKAKGSPIINYTNQSANPTIKDTINYSPHHLPTLLTPHSQQPSTAFPYSQQQRSQQANPLFFAYQKKITDSNPVPLK